MAGNVVKCRVLQTLWISMLAHVRKEEAHSGLNRSWRSTDSFINIFFWFEWKDNVIFSNFALYHFDLRIFFLLDCLPHKSEETGLTCCLAYSWFKIWIHAFARDMCKIRKIDKASTWISMADSVISADNRYATPKPLMEQYSVHLSAEQLFFQYIFSN